MKNIGLFGLGLIGSALAERLLAAGHKVSGADVDEACKARLAELGGTPAAADELLARDALQEALRPYGER